MIRLLQKMVCVVWKIRILIVKKKYTLKGLFRFLLRQRIFDLSLDKRT